MKKEKEKHNLIIKGIKKSWNDEDLNRYIEEIRQEARKELIEEVINWKNEFWKNNLRGLIGLFKWNQSINNLIKEFEKK